jgi:hypothetical protein
MLFYETEELITSSLNPVKILDEKSEELIVESLAPLCRLYVFKKPHAIKCFTVMLIGI